MKIIRTSLTDPIRIAELRVGDLGGAVGVTFAPGKRQEDAMTGAWERDLDVDLMAIRAWGATQLVSLLEAWEFDELQIRGLPQRTRDFGMSWHGLPITDGFAPDERFLELWLELGPALIRALLAGERILVHCKGGLGRAGTVASMLLLDSGAAISPDEAIQRLRAVRPGAIETPEQEAFLRAWPNLRRLRDQQ